MTALLLLGAGALDLLLGDPPRPTHPVAAIGRLIARLERLLWRDARLPGVLLVLTVLAATVGGSWTALRLLAPGLPPRSCWPCGG